MDTTNEILKANKYNSILKLALSSENKDFINSYKIFRTYSPLNRIYAMNQLILNKKKIQPIATMNQWRIFGRKIKKGSKAISLYVPNIKKRHNEETNTDEITFITYYNRKGWFILEDTEGEDFNNIKDYATWNHNECLEKLNITKEVLESLSVTHISTAKDRKLYLSQTSLCKNKDVYHAMAHILLGHTLTHNYEDYIVKSLDKYELEAEITAFICCKFFDDEVGVIETSEYIRKYAAVSRIEEDSIRKALKTADRIIYYEDEEKIDKLNY